MEPRNKPQEKVSIGMLVAPDISQLISQREFLEVRSALRDLLLPDVADVLSELEPRERVVAFRLLHPDRVAEVFTLLPDDLQHRLLEELGQDQLADIFSSMEPDDRTELLGEIPEQQVERLLSILKPEERKQAESLLEYPPQSVGRLVTPRFLTVRPEWDAQQVLEHIRREGEQAETLETLYVVDEQGQLVDDLPLRTVLLSPLNRRVRAMVDGQAVSLQADEDREEAVRVMERYDSPTLPVVDTTGRMVGIVTFDDVADVAEEEATEDFHKVAAVAPLPLGYMQTSIWSLYRRRIGWLVALVFVSLLSSGVIAAYEQTLEAVITLAFFLPLLIASGGNTGAQGATLMIRALATDDLRLSQWWHAMGKELILGVILGLTMAVASGFLGMIRGGPWIALIVGLSMFCIVLATNLLGVLLPFVLTKLKLDPAVASSPLITTIADATGLLIYFSIATSVIRAMSQGA